jgi:hypothetical protein
MDIVIGQGEELHQSKDLGRRCMLLIMEEARQLGLPVRLRVMKANPRALAFGLGASSALTSFALVWPTRIRQGSAIQSLL